jgi:hypothetical protein
MARAEVRSIDALNQFRLALVEYEDQMLDSLTMLKLELHKATVWIDHEQPTYWSSESRRSSEKLVVAHNDLERCEMAIRIEDRKSCMVEKKALERAKLRLRLCDQKINTVKKWKVVLHQESSLMTGRLAKLRDVIERELPRAMATMERLVSSLEQYAAIAETPSNAKKDASSSSEAADESPTDSNSENGSSADASL